MLLQYIVLSSRNWGKLSGYCIVEVTNLVMVLQYIVFSSRNWGKQSGWCVSVSQELWGSNYTVDSMASTHT